MKITKKSIENWVSTYKGFVIGAASWWATTFLLNQPQVCYQSTTMLCTFLNNVVAVPASFLVQFNVSNINVSTALVAVLIQTLTWGFIGQIIYNNREKIIASARGRK